MGRYTFDAPATVTLHVDADSEDEARTMVYALGSDNPDWHLDEGVTLHDLTIGQANVKTVECVSGPEDEYEYDEDDDENECEGHESLDGAHEGESVYCDGSCRKR
ncbi:hypothetical protein [Micromonospora maritima]|uniref:hypothetical protein n=1 Tax=Micromonospora maritima TaxID=986711 RepID=UPI00157CC713|nr:hypothetical protein [Micromonospora maritima]